MSHVLLPYVHGNQSSPELGPPRLRQVRLQEGKLGVVVHAYYPAAAALQLSFVNSVTV